MAYDSALADRIRSAVREMKHVAEKAMFGGVAWMHRGNMFVGIMKDELFVRVGKEQHEHAARRPHARTADFMRKPMPGFILVGAPGVASVPEVQDWVSLAMAFVGKMPAKALKAAAKPKSAKRVPRTKKAHARPRTVKAKPKPAAKRRSKGRGRKRT